MQSYAPSSSASSLQNDNNMPLVRLANEVKKVIVGNDAIIDYVIISILCNGHVLLEGMPGVGKTLLVKTFTKALGLSFKRIQFTPDLLPSDLIGTMIYNAKTQDFETKKGPLFAQLILADEINRAPAKVQAALLEAMQEHQVTIGSQSFALQRPFIVFATQNPIDQEGTYQLPEAQIDRFMFKLTMQYPQPSEEKTIILRGHHTLDVISEVMTHQELIEQQQLMESIYIDQRVIDYITCIIGVFRNPDNYGMHELNKFIRTGISSRATLALYQASKAYAFIAHRHFVIPDDVKAVAPFVLGHRLMINYQAEVQGVSVQDIIRTVLQKLPCP